MKQKHIDIIVKYFYPVAAGIETNILETYSVLAKKGWSITIHTSTDTLTEKNVLSSQETIRGLTVKRYPCKWYGYIPSIAWDKTNLVCLHNFNIVPHGYLLFYSWIRSLMGKKSYGIILTPHGGFTPDWAIFSKITAIIKKLYHYSYGSFMINVAVDKVRAVSEWERNEICKKFVMKKKVTVISNGLEDQAYLDVEKMASKEIKKKIKSFGRYLVQVGRIYKIKNYETTIKALTKVDSSVHYVIAGPIGSETYLQKLKTLIDTLGLTDRVHFIGVVRGVDKYYLMKKASMMVHMAHWESFCNVIHEGMSQGLVCIVANNTALPLLIKNNINGYCLPTTDSNAVAKKINYVLTKKNTTEIKAIQKRNIDFARAESWSDVAQKMDHIYNLIYKSYES